MVQKRVEKKDPEAINLLGGNGAKNLSMVQARVGKKDPEAINCLGENYGHRTLGFQENTRKSVELWTEAAELGSIKAPDSSKKPQCEEVLRAGTVLVFVRYRKGTMTAQ